MADNDPQQELKKRARRRLVGALALALAAVILLPMLMDREPRPSANELQIRIPSQEGSNFAARAITGAAPSPARPLETSSVPVAQSRVSPVETRSAEKISEPIAGASKPEHVSPKPKAVPEERKPEPEHKLVAERKQENSPQPKKPEPTRKQEEDLRARAILEGRTDKSREEKTSIFYVQLGVYRDAENAREVQTKAASLGVKCVLEKAGVATRVRVGPFSDRVAAEQVAAKLKEAGLPGFVAAK